MENNTTVKDVILDKKLDGYGTNDNDFLASGELTVTITLEEYRKLVEKCATRDYCINEAEKDKYTRENENEELRKENAELKAELYELQKQAADDEEGEQEREHDVL